MPQVAIGPRFFKNAKKDYADWKWALIREFMQNSLDAKSTTVDILCHYNSDLDVTELQVRDNGIGMSRDILVNKLLALGESGKEFEGTVGGFGKAKELCYFCHEGYRIYTGDMEVVGCGADYDINPSEKIKGTTSLIELKGNYEEDLCKQVRRFAKVCQWKGDLFLNNEHLPTNLRKGKRRRELSWGTIYTNKVYADVLIVRMQGTPMFIKHVEAEGRGVIIELKHSSDEVLQASRDGLRWMYSQELDEFVRQITIDKKSAFREQSGPTYTIWEGEDLQAYESESTFAELLQEAFYAVDPASGESQTVAAFVSQNEDGTMTVEEADGTVFGSEGVNEETDQRPTLSVVEDEESERKFSYTERAPEIGHRFIIKNELGITIPDWFTPDKFSKYSKKVVKAWAAILIELHVMVGRTDPFSVGFIFDDPEEDGQFTAAECEYSSDLGQVFYINPVRVVRNEKFGSRSLSLRWKFNKTGKMAMLADAVHEFVHAMGYSGHDESYAGKLTDLFALVLSQYSRFHKCFR